MIEIFMDNAGSSGKTTYKTERFCTLLDRNIILSVEMHSDGSELKICHDINACKNKEQCRYFAKPKSGEFNYI